MTISVTPGSATVLSSETSLSGGVQATSGRLDVVLDVSNLALGDRVRLRVKQTVNGGSAAAVIERIIEGVQAESVVFENLLVDGNWEVTGQTLAGSDRSIGFSLRIDEQDVTSNDDAALISSTEYFLAADGVGASPQTADVYTQLVLDPLALSFGDEFVVRAYEKANAGTMRQIYSDILRGERDTFWASPLLIMGEGWEFSVQKVSGTDRSIPWSIRRAVPEAGAAPPIPVLANATTVESIRDRIIAVIGSLVPNHMPRDRFRKHRNEFDGNFLDYSDKAPATAQRKFQVRSKRTDEVVTVSNHDYDLRYVTFQVSIAYPHTARTGPDQAMDRDDEMDQDFHQIDYEIGIYGRRNFSPSTDPSYPDATPMGASMEVVEGAACDFLVITAEFSYRRSSQ